MTKDIQINLDNPASIYDIIKKEVDGIANNLAQLQHANLKLETSSHDQARNILASMQEKVNSSINELKNNAEWDYFSIAFFGETNAGKSTLIDTLRILFKEESKMAQQAQYRKMIQELHISNEDYDNLLNKIQQTNKQLENILQVQENAILNFDTQISDKEQDLQALTQELQNDLATLHALFDDQISANQAQIAELQATIKQKRSEMSWLLKIIYFFKRLDEEKQLAPIKQQLHQINSNKKAHEQLLQDEQSAKKQVILGKINDLLTKKDQRLEQFHNQIDAIKTQQAALQQQYDAFHQNLTKLNPYLDGQIIGDGRSDFTRDTTSFMFNINGQKVKMLDVPGIEGKEELVEKEISSAVQKTHAVFYVTAKDAKPNEGTLERIQKYLSDQTEVWTIYNKQITNAKRQLKRDLIHSADDRASLEEVSQLLAERLGDHYKELIVVAGLPAFYSQATCLKPFSERYNGRKKFLSDFNTDALMQKSNLALLENRIINDIVGDVPAKIKRSNFNKVKQLIDQSNADLKQIHATYQNFEREIKKKVAIAKIGIDGHFDSFESQVRSLQGQCIDRFMTKTREEIYVEIESDISNDAFKKAFEYITDAQSERFEQDVQKQLQQAVGILGNNIEQEQNSLLKEMEKLGNEYRQFVGTQGLDFNLDFSMDNGIKVGGLLAVAAGIGALITFPPAGIWVLAISAIGLLWTFIDAILGFFSSDYKQKQQRKNADENLRKIRKGLEKDFGKNLKPMLDDIRERKESLAMALDNLPYFLQQTNNDLKHSIEQFDDISAQITQVSRS